eukprot:1149435-Pelagomonas_calceolata.AAC.11
MTQTAHALATIMTEAARVRATTMPQTACVFATVVRQTVYVQAKAAQLFRPRRSKCLVLKQKNRKAYASQ